MTVALVATAFFSTSVFADSSHHNNTKISATGAVVVNAKNGNVLYSKNANKRFYPASTTKIMHISYVQVQRT